MKLLLLDDSGRIVCREASFAMTSLLAKPRFLLFPFCFLICTRFQFEALTVVLVESREYKEFSCAILFHIGDFGKCGFIAQLNEDRHLKKMPTEFQFDQIL